MPAPMTQPDARSEALRLLARFVAKAIREGRAPSQEPEAPHGRTQRPLIVKEAS